MASWALSCIYAVSIFAIGMIGAISPIALRHSRSKNRDKFLSLGSLFGAGVFLSAGFVHLLGDAAADLDNEYPWAMLVASSSLILTMFIDKAVISLVKDRQALHGRQSVEQSSSATLACASNEEEADESEESDIELSHNFELHGDAFAAFVMFSALSFHSFLAGLSLGADPEGTAIFIAIMAHKGFGAFALGTNFVRATKWNSNDPIPSRTIFVWMVIFSLVTPIGVFVGTAVQNAGESAATAVVIAAASGTFIYVALVEVAIPEFERHGNTREKISSIVAGYALMSVLAIWV